MVREFGLSEAIGPVSYGPSGRLNPALAGSPSHSERTQWLVDREVTALLTKAEARAQELLTAHQQALSQLTTALLEQETITGEQVRAIVAAASPGPPGKAIRPGRPEPAAQPVR
jgi:cell division protease FtsH